MKNDLAQQAINAALTGRWSEAIKINLQIIKKNKNDLDALNRLARAYAEQGHLAKAKKTSQKVLKIDPFNKIAQKCLEKWKGLKKDEVKSSQTTSADNFIEEPGKTKIVTLLYPGAEKIIAKLDAGDEVRLNYHGHRVSVLDQNGKYIGRLPDDLGARLKKFIKEGNEYRVLVKSTEGKDVKVFIRETKQSPKLKDRLSFPTEKIEYISFIPPELVHKKDTLVIDQEEE